MNKIDLAISLHNEGYNCAQAVFCSFSEELGLSKEIAYRVSEGFGRGFGGIGSTCGAFSALVMVVSYLNSNYNMVGKTKESTYEDVTKLSKEFLKRFQSLECPLLKERVVQENSNCDRYIQEAVELAMKYLEKK